MRLTLVLAALVTAACAASSTTASEADDTVITTTSTSTTPTTLAAEDSNPRLVFDGTGCEYTGPTEFSAATLRFDFVNDSDTEANLSVWAVPEGTTADEIDVEDTWLDRSDFDMQNVRWGQRGPGWETTLVAALEPGYHMLNCFVLEDDATAAAPAANHVTFFTVTG